MTSTPSITGLRISPSATALKILATSSSDTASIRADNTVIDAARSSSQTMSFRALDAITQIAASDREAARAKIDSEGAKWSYRPERTMPVSQLDRTVPTKDAAAMQALGADQWVAHYAPTLSKYEFEAESKKTLEYNLQASDIADSFKYYQNAFSDPNTQSALSEDGKVLVSRETLELSTKRYQVEMSARKALADGSISFSMPEAEVGLDYVGVSYDMYKDGKFHGNFLNYTYNTEYTNNLEKQKIGTYSWGVGLLGFYAKFKMLDISEIGG